MNNTFRINENLTVDGPFRDFLIATSSCRVTMVISSFVTLNEVNFLTITDKPDTVSYLPASKLDSVLSSGMDPYSDGVGRVHMKVGRLISKLFPKKLIEQYITPKDLEEFVNLYKSFFDDTNKRMEIVSGEDIRKYYLDYNYSSARMGSLWKSCMRYAERQLFLDLYVVNPDKIKMLVLLINENGVEKVKARALLWEDVEDERGNRLKVMDRIYTVYDSDVHIFKRWARENGYISKFYQNAKSQNVYDMEGHEKHMNLNVSLENHKLVYYPYLDSFQFYDPSTGRFHNNEMSPYEYVLIQATGTLSPVERDEPEDDDGEDISFSFSDWDSSDEAF